MSEQPSPPTNNSLPCPRAPVMDFSIAGDDADPAVWDWGNLLDFALHGGDDDSLMPSWLPSPSLPPLDPPPPPPTVVGSSGVRKRDPRLVCENYMAGRVPCSCPEMDEMDLEEDDDEVEVGERKKRPKPTTTTTAAITVRCQVPTCEAGIAELKGYHRRRRICLRCANASSVVLDGDLKRYCQQCGKFHILPDFDEGKRSCRRKLERHNKRRRRRPNGGKNMVEHENESQGDFLAETTFDEQENRFARGTVESLETVVSNKIMDGNILESEDRPGSSISSLPRFQNDQSNNTASFAASGIDQVDERVDNMKSVHSSTFYGSKSVYSSVCPTGRISFKLYDWNPAEFPRRLRHQIFEWLASMPVELEGYIRPGCTILTLFIAMPRFMWEKLYQDVDLYVKDLINAPDSLFLGRADFLIYINNQILQILKDGTLLMNIKMKESAPRLHYVYPTYFEAGKPMQFVACGSNLDQPRLRFLVSFSGRYLVCNSCHARSHGKIGLCDENGGNSDHEIFRIDITHTDPNFFGPAFIEVENQSGLSNFVPVLLGSELICSELERISESPVANSIMSQCALGDVTPGLCEIFVSEQGAMSELLLDIAWLLKDLRLEKEEFDLSWTNIQRLTRLLQFSIQNGFVNVREMIRRYLDKTDWVGFQKPITLYTDSELLVKFMSHRREDLSHKSLHDLPSRFEPRDSSDRLLIPHSFSNSEMIFTVCSTNQEEGIIPLISKAVDHSRWSSLKIGNEWFRRSHRRSIGTGTRLTVFAAVSACVIMCFGACVLLLHPREFVVTVWRCLLGGPPPT